MHSVVDRRVVRSTDESTCRSRHDQFFSILLETARLAPWHCRDDVASLPAEILLVDPFAKRQSIRRNIPEYRLCLGALRHAETICASRPSTPGSGGGDPEKEPPVFGVFVVSRPACRM